MKNQQMVTILRRKSLDRDEFVVTFAVPRTIEVLPSNMSGVFQALGVSGDGAFEATVLSLEDGKTISRECAVDERTLFQLGTPE